MCECVRMCVLVCDRAHLYVHTCTDMCFEASMCVFMRVPEFKCITMLSYKGICIIMHFVCVCVCVCNPNPSDFHCVLFCSSWPFPDHLDVLEVIRARDLPPACKGVFDITVMDWSGKNIGGYKDVGKCCTFVFAISCLEILFKKQLGKSKSVLSLLPPEYFGLSFHSY